MYKDALREEKTRANEAEVRANLQEAENKRLLEKIAQL